MTVYDELYLFLNKFPSIILNLLPVNGSDQALELVPKISALLGLKGNLSCFPPIRR